MSDGSTAAVAEDMGFDLRDTIYLANSAVEIFIVLKSE